MRTRTVIVGLVGLVVLVSVLVPALLVSDSAVNDDLVLTSTLQPFDGCEELLEYYQDAALDLVGPYGLGFPLGVVADGAERAMAVDDAGAGEDSAVAAPAPEAPAGTAEQAVGPGETGTNVQESGVDEPDIVKTDGSLALAVARGDLQVVDLTGAQPELVGSLPLPGGWDQELLIDGDRALVLTRTDAFRPLPMRGGLRDLPAPPSGGGGPTSTVSLVDLSDPAEPRIESTLTLDGDYRSARMVEGVARIVIHSPPAGLAFTAPETGGLRAEREATERNREVIRSSAVEDWLPWSVVEDGDGRAVSEGPLLDCERVRHPQEFAGLATLSVLTVDPDGPLEPGEAAGVVADGETVYASTDRLYVATSSWGSWRPLPAEGSRPEQVTTEIHAFDLSDPATAPYLASGAVRGHLLNQYSMSAHEGHLRVAVTEQPDWWPSAEGAASESSVVVLAEQDDELVEVGRVGGLGRTERIYAVRYLGDLAAVVTFRQTDPLYVLDLSDPTAPRLEGELKIPGYSSYLHPVGDDLLLGVGQDADDAGRVLGVQASLFDLSDRSAPERIAQVTFGEGSSEVEHNPRAFLYWPPEGLAVLPLQTYDFDERTGVDSGFSGAVALAVESRDLREKGRLSHEPAAESADDPGVGVAPGEPMPFSPTQEPIRRALVVDGVLYTLSERGLAAHDLDTLAETGFARFT
ncbi:MAG: benzoate transporter [Nitriliruptorales bacterium]|nr:benzoate transporter [Nitriliruptorales bacterium]